MSATKVNKEKIILGVDPGTNVMGFGAIMVVGQKINLLGMGIVDLKKETDYAVKLKLIFERTQALVDEYKPDQFAVEAPFFGKNVQSMLKLGRAQGVSMAAALMRDVPISEYSPRKIKQSITGSGAASKEQVAAMLKNIIGYKEQPKYLDATDGIAAAVCHHFQSSAGIPASGKKNWDDFIRQNPDRVR